MKKIAYLLSCALLILTTAAVQAQSKIEKNLDSFTRVSFRAAGKLYLKQGATQRFEIEGDRKFIDDLDIRVEGGKLTIGRDDWGRMRWTDREDEKVTVYITIPKVEGIYVAGSGDVIVQGKLSTSDLELKVSGSGTMQLDTDATGTIDADVSGSGNIELTGRCRDFESHVSGSGRVKLNVSMSERALFGISGSGRIYAAGSAREVKATISGSGEVLAADLVVDACDVRISGSGGVEINVNKELDATISGSGSVRYKGNPSHVNSHSSGSGKVRKL